VLSNDGYGIALGPVSAYQCVHLDVAEPSWDLETILETYWLDLAWDIISLRISGPDRRLTVMHFTLQQRADSTAQHRNGRGMKDKSNAMQLSGAIHARIDRWLALPPKEPGLRSRLDSLKRKGGISGSMSKIRLTEDKKAESTPRSR
jgi:hypothetical protein